METAEIEPNTGPLPTTGKKVAQQELPAWGKEPAKLDGRIIAPVTLRVRRYRQKHLRIDYFPAPDVLAIIEYHQAAGKDPCFAGIIDELIRVGHKTVSGNGGKK